MTKLIITLCFSIFLVSCATNQMKPVPPKTPYETGVGFTTQIPPNGPWYEIKTPEGGGFVLGREPSSQDKEDGSTVIAEVRFGKLDVKELKLKKYPEVLKFFENTMKQPELADRFEKTSSHFKNIKFKGAECMNYEQISEGDKLVKSRKGEPMKMSVRGLVCLHPKDLGTYIRMTISQRIPNSRPFEDLKVTETQFYNTLSIGPIPK